MQDNHRLGLERLDAITFEEQLQKTVKSILPFESYSLTFPRKGDKVRPAHDAEEKRILLPLPDDEDRVLSVFVARGVDGKKAHKILPLWPEIAKLISSNLLYYKRSLTDPVTGLYTRHYLMERLEKELSMLRQDSPLGSLRKSQEEGSDLKESMDKSQKAKASKSSKASASFDIAENFESSRHLENPEADTKSKNLKKYKTPKDPINLEDAINQDKEIGTKIKTASLYSGASFFSGRGSIGLIVVRMSALRGVVREYGYQFADSLMRLLADAIKSQAPEQALTARTGDSEFALILPSATKRACTKLSSKLVPALNAIYLEHPLRKEQVSIRASIGYVLYPQDAAGSFAIKPAPEQARILLRKARLASALADEQSHDWKSVQRVMGFGDILSQGGRVIDVLPLSSVVVSLGASMHAREGQRFTVWSMPKSQSGLPSSPFYKGEISLMDVHENSSQAEILHLGDPAWNIEAGDRLVLLPEEQGSKRKTEKGPLRHDPVTNFLVYGDFLDQWTQKREKDNNFLLSLIRLFPKKEDKEEFEDSSALSPTDTTVAEIADMIREAFGNDILGGRYGLNSLVVFHSEAEAEEVAEKYKNLSENAKKHLGVAIATGIAPHPFLDFRKADSLENSRKALEYAQLLPAPHVGILDSLAINISADKRFSHGDTFGAIKEYKLALLADETNILAWNSLGICMASLGRSNEALEYFSSALTHDPLDIMAHYNMGNLYQAEGRWKEAKKYFEKCCELDKNHLFALLRLGQLAENENKKSEARAYYEKAAQLPGGEGYTHRHFARLALSENNEGEAREHLHSALLHDPQDAIALGLLSGIYLDAGEDPDMAASLARQAVSLRPDLKKGWFELARALEAMGRENEAREARIRAGAL